LTSIDRTVAYLPLLPRITSPHHFWYICEVLNVFEAWA